MIATSDRIVLSGSALAFDFQATTPCAAEVVEAMAPFWSADWGNPSSRQHRLGLSASAAVKVARRQLAEAVGVNFVQKCGGTRKLCSRVLACCVDQFVRGMFTLGGL